VDDDTPICVGLNDLMSLRGPLDLNLEQQTFNHSYWLDADPRSPWVSYSTPTRWFSWDSRVSF